MGVLGKRVTSNTTLDNDVRSCVTIHYPYVVPCSHMSKWGNQKESHKLDQNDQNWSHYVFPFWGQTTVILRQSHFLNTKNRLEYRTIEKCRKKSPPYFLGIGEWHPKLLKFASRFMETSWINSSQRTQIQLDKVIVRRKYPFLIGF